MKGSRYHERKLQKYSEESLKSLKSPFLGCWVGEAHFLAYTVISVNMPTPHFYRKYAHPFSEGSFLKILW